MNDIKLFFDMDEVIVGLSKYIVEDCYNDNYNDNMKWTDNHKYWWSDCKLADKSYFQQLLLKEGTFLYPKPIEGAIEILNKLHKEGYDIHIITSPQWESRYCIREKVQWIEKHLPFININSNFHCTDNKGLLAKENRILIDDNPQHLNNWRNNEGISICFNYENVYEWSRDWNGIVCYNWYGVYIKINELGNKIRNELKIDDLELIEEEY